MFELPDTPRVSIILCTYSEDMVEDLHAAAESVLRQTYEDVELVLVVDGNQELYDELEAEYHQLDGVILHANEKNLGLLESRNTGAELATGAIVAFIDDDAIADERWVAELVRSYREHDALAVGGKMAPAWVAGKPGFLPAEFYWLVGVTHKGFSDGPGEVRNTFGSNLSFRRDVFLDLGGFDADIGGRKGKKNLQGGETELCARLREHYGEGVYYNPDAVVEHKVFEYRTRFRWLLDRAFWQGFSKRRMETLLDADRAEESAFLRRLVTEFVPDRIGHLARSPSTEKLSQLVTLVLLTASVGLGYLYAVLRG